jgi:major vault protein
MSNENRLKVPVARRMFLWSLNESSGEVITHIGPTEFTPSANDRVVRSNGKGGFEQPPTMEARPFIVARDGEYVLLANPVRGDSPEDYPNGSFVPGANKEKDLVLGSTKIIPGPCGFPLWPGQSAEVRQAHKLGANHYLLVEVVGPLDEKARYAKLVRESAGLSSAVIDSGESTTPAGPTPQQLAGSASQLQLGQRIVIQGRHTQLFIPPTGIEIVPPADDIETKSAGDGADNLSASATQEYTKLLSAVKEGLTAKQFSVLKNEIRHRNDLNSAEKAVILTGMDEAFDERQSGQGKKRERESRGSRTQSPADPYARRAVVLGPKEFCFLFDADGHARIVRGPARVFPGPYDTFLQRGSRKRSYDAYELAEHQSLWLRIISPIPRGQLEKYLPTSVELTRDIYEPGHEFIVKGLPTVFFPFIEAEVLNPHTRDPHIGNDHENAIINSVGIEQKSGIYVRDLRSGVVKMVRGETSYLVDPRFEDRVPRRIPKDLWNLWVGHAEAHKATTEKEVSTPWALSISIPNNEAVCVTSRYGRRVEIGPKVILLEYEEHLTPLRLSKGPSKDGHTLVTSAFLRAKGARVADTFEVESSDFIKLRVKLGFAGHFEANNEDEKEKWFHVEDPVKLLADTVRARMREAASVEPAAKLLKQMPQLVRSVLLTEGKALRFEENNMVIENIDVLSVNIIDAGLSGLFTTAHLEAVKAQLKEEEANRKLAAIQHQDSLDAKEVLIRNEAAKRLAQLRMVEADSTHKAELNVIQLKTEREKFVKEHERKLAQDTLGLELEQSKQRAESASLVKLLDAESQSKAKSQLFAVDEKHKEFLAKVEKELARGLAEADAVKLQAIQRELVGALQSASDSEVLKAAAQNMNLVSLLGGKSPAELLGQLVKGTPLSRTTLDMLTRERLQTEEK